MKVAQRNENESNSDLQERLRAGCRCNLYVLLTSIATCLTILLFTHNCHPLSLQDCETIEGTALGTYKSSDGDAYVSIKTVEKSEHRIKIHYRFHDRIKMVGIGDSIVAHMDPIGLANAAAQIEIGDQIVYSLDEFNTSRRSDLGLIQVLTWVSLAMCFVVLPLTIKDAKRNAWGFWAD